MASTTLASFLALLQLVPTSPILSSCPFPSSSPFESFNDWGGGDKTNPSPGRSPKQPLPGIGLYDPLYGRQAYPELNSFHQEVGQISTREELFSCYPRPPLIVEQLVPMSATVLASVRVPVRSLYSSTCLYPRPRAQSGLVILVILCHSH